MADATTLVLFGATSDLARGRLWPALHDLAASGRLPADTGVLGISRSAGTEDLRAMAAEHGPRGRLDSTPAWEALVGRIEAVNGSADDPALYERLERALQERPGRRLSYLSVAPSLFDAIGGRLAGIGLGRESGSASRLVIEKPFGRDLATARALHDSLHEHFDEDQVLRIDHYLGKETVQNLLVLRFGNGILEPIWDRRTVDHVQITVAEDGGIEQRGEFYDATGALRDVGQNHLLQLLALTAMEPLGRVNSEELHQERLKVLRALVPLERRNVVLGQYAGYGSEEGVAGGSRTDTYAAMRIYIESWRWAGVPFYLRTGKRLAAKMAEIAVVFRPAPHPPFGEGGRPAPNRLVVGIQPGQRIHLHMTGKRPGEGLSLADVDLDFDAGEAAEQESPEAYERLLGDAFAGDTTLFASAGEVEAQWSAVEPVLVDRPDPEVYAPGSEGPDGAAEMLAGDGRRWRRISG